MKNLIHYSENSEQKNIIRYFEISKDEHGTILMFLRLPDKYHFLDIQPQIKTFKDDECKNYLLCFCEDCDGNVLSKFEVDIPFELYNKYIGMTNFHYTKNKEEYYIVIHPQKFNYQNCTVLYSKAFNKKILL
jgi:hypothetical protein